MFKKIFILIILIYSNIVFSQIEFPNGGFENGTKEPFGGDTSICSIVGTPIHSGSKALQFNIGWNIKEIYTYPINISPNTDYVFHIWHYYSSGGTFRVDLKYPGTTIQLVLEDSTFYKEYTIAFNPGDNTSFQVYITNPAGTNAMGYFDDLSLEGGALPPDTKQFFIFFGD